MTRPLHSPRSQNLRRKGTVYALVLGVALIVSVLGVSGAMLVRSHSRQLRHQVDGTQARYCARAAVSRGLQAINSQPDSWRDRGSGTWFSGQSLAGGTFSLHVTDPTDGDITNEEGQNVLLTAEGAYGQSRHTLRVLLEPIPGGLTCLESCFHVDSHIVFLNGSVVDADATISSNGMVMAIGSTINAPVEATQAVAGGAFNHDTTAGVAERSMPGADVFQTYIDMGTEIDVYDLPNSAGKYWIQHEVLSPNRNPFGGGTNAKGVYVIDCKGQTVLIRKSRIIGTLVLLNPGGNSRVTNSNSIQPAEDNYPSLLVSGNMIFSGSAQPLSEADEDVNYNPSGAPHEGKTDDSKDDSYSSVVKGIVYVSGLLYLYRDYNHFEGAVVAPMVSIQDSIQLKFEYDDAFIENPPPGFVGPPRMLPVRGSWRQHVD